MAGLREFAVDLDRAGEHEVRHACRGRRAREPHRRGDVGPPHRGNLVVTLRARPVHARGEVHDRGGAAQRECARARVQRGQVADGQVLGARRHGAVERTHEAAHAHSARCQERHERAPDEPAGARDDDGATRLHQNHFQPWRR